MVDAPLDLVLGLLSGVVFGFLLQKGRVAKHGVIVGQLVLRDFTVIEIMLTAIAVGAAGFWALVALGAVPVKVKEAEMGGVLLGALLFGSGLALLGFPGTTVAAMGEGRRDAVFGFLGMVTGALAFVLGFPFFGRVQEAVADWGKLTLPDATNLSPFIWVICLAALAAALYAVARRRRYTPSH